MTGSDQKIDRRNDGAVHALVRERLGEPVAYAFRQLTDLCEMDQRVRERWYADDNGMNIPAQAYQALDGDVWQAIEQSSEILWTNVAPGGRRGCGPRSCSNS